MPRVAGRLFGFLLPSADPQSLDALASQLGVSKASISINARMLEEKGVVERVGRQADRRDYYRISDDILERTLEQRIARIRRFNQAITVARAACATEHDVVCQRLENMERAHNHIIEVTERALEEWRTHRGSTPSPSKAR